MANVETVPNQRIVTTNKAACSGKSSNEYYTPINLLALEKAMQKLSANAFKMWAYLGKNQDKYTFALSKVDTLKWCNFSEGTYTRAFKELIEEGYLVCKEKGSNCYDFYEVSQKQEEIQEPVITIHKAEGSINDFKF